MLELKQRFLDKYIGKQPSWGFDGLGYIIYLRTYARKKEDGNLEDWWETVRRVTEGNFNIEYNRLRKLNKLTDERKKELELEMEQFYHLVFNLIISPPGRGLWMSGTEYSKINGDSLNNCWAVTMKPQEYERGGRNKASFAPCFTFDQAMKGGGVGVNIQNKNIDKFNEVLNSLDVIFVKNSKLVIDDNTMYPKLGTEYIEQDKDYIYRIPDTRQGWVKSLELLIDNHFEYFSKSRLVFDISDIRGYGEPIKGFGGTASGPVPLMRMLKKVNTILNNKLDKKLTSVDWGDIVQLIGTCVVAGNVRRTALILIGDIEDKEFMDSKNYEKYPEASSWRWASNNSVDFSSKKDKKEFIKLMEYLYKAGEPGYVNIELSRHFGRIIDGYQHNIDSRVEGFNPCFTGDMELLTTEGYKTFEQLNGKEVNIINYNGDVCQGKVWKSGEKPTVKLNLSNKTQIKCTENHVFMTNDNKEVMAKDSKGKRIRPYLYQNRNLDSLYVKLGYIQGDGNLSRLKSKDHLGIEINIGEKDKDVARFFGYTDKDFNKDGRKVYTTEFTSILKELYFSEEILPSRELPKNFDSWSTNQKLSFIRGLYSANGSVINTGRVSLKTSNKVLANSLVEQLKQLKIKAYITTNKKNKVKFDNGIYECKESYNIEIQDYNSRVSFYNMIGFIHDYKNDKLKELLIKQSPLVLSIKDSGIKEVFDFNEPVTNWGVVNGLIAHNCGEIPLPNAGACNLFEINAPRIQQLINDGVENEQLYELATKLATRYAYRVTFRPYEWEKTRTLIEEERRIGIGITGVTDWIAMLKEKNLDVRAYLNEMYETVKFYNLLQSKELEANKSIKLTTVKPSGTVSILMGVSPGQHYHWSKYMIRRVRISSTSSLIPVLRECGYKIEFAINGYKQGKPTFDETTCVVEFPIKAPTAESKHFKGAKEVTPEEQLKIQSLLQAYWADNSVSATISFEPPSKKPVFFEDGTMLLDKFGKPVLEINPNEEKELIEELGTLLFNYKDKIKSTTFLPHSNDSYDQMPYEEITKEQYDNMRSKIDKNIWEVYQGEFVEDDSQLLEGCVGGSCPIK